jgi:hypothetical protein
LLDVSCVGALAVCVLLPFRAAAAQEYGMITQELNAGCCFKPRARTKPRGRCRAPSTVN